MGPDRRVVGAAAGAPPDRSRGIEGGDRLVDRADLPGDLADAEVGLRQFAAELGVVAPLLDEILVILQAPSSSNSSAQAADIDGVLLLEQRILADARQVIPHGPVSHAEVGLGQLAGLSLAASALLDEHHADRRRQGDADDGGAGRVGPGPMLAQPSARRAPGRHSG